MVQGGEPVVRRAIQGNQYRFGSVALTTDSLRVSVPIDMGEQLLCEMLTEQLGRQVHLLGLDVAPPEGSGVLSSMPTDTILRKMMYDSDNFLAEQLLLACSQRLLGQMNSRQALRLAMDSVMHYLPKGTAWVDGSGLSRYNLLTPRAVVAVLDDLYRQFPREKILGLFPVGGVSGTTKNWYAGNPPYVFAKTGTLTGVHCLSGYVITASGRTLIFSFMHNNYVTPAAELKSEMARVLEWIRERY
jgi:D-alanyl-D-alanine carboxypeptidase/D-alanyl-D-alanine-endopeptidase (penicillin-binding protein 4)